MVPALQPGDQAEYWRRLALQAEEESDMKYFNSKSLIKRLDMTTVPPLPLGDDNDGMGPFLSSSIMCEVAPVADEERTASVRVLPRR